MHTLVTCSVNFSVMIVIGSLSNIMMETYDMIHKAKSCHHIDLFRHVITLKIYYLLFLNLASG